MQPLIPKETSGSGREPRATQAKLHIPSNALEAEQLRMLAHGVDNNERSVPDWSAFKKDQRYKYQSYGAYKHMTHIWEDDDDESCIDRKITYQDVA